MHRARAGEQPRPPSRTFQSAHCVVGRGGRAERLRSTGGQHRQLRQRRPAAWHVPHRKLLHRARRVRQAAQRRDLRPDRVRHPNARHQCVAPRLSRCQRHATVVAQFRFRRQLCANPRRAQEPADRATGLRVAGHGNRPASQPRLLRTGVRHRRPQGQSRGSQPRRGVARRKPQTPPDRRHVAAGRHPGRSRRGRTP